MFCTLTGKLFSFISKFVCGFMYSEDWIIRHVWSHDIMLGLYRISEHPVRHEQDDMQFHLSHIPVMI